MVKKEEIQAPSPALPSFGMDDLLRVIQDSKDPREIAYTKLVDHLWNKDKLMMISRLDRELFYYSVKNLIIIAFFQKYWCEAEAKITLKPIDTPPYYEQDVEYVYPYDNGRINPEYKTMIENIWELTISKGGLGRSEILKLIDRSGSDMGVKDQLSKMVNR